MTRTGVSLWYNRSRVLYPGNNFTSLINLSIHEAIITVNTIQTKKSNKHYLSAFWSSYNKSTHQLANA